MKEITVEITVQVSGKTQFPLAFDSLELQEKIIVKRFFWGKCFCSYEISLRCFFIFFFNVFISDMSINLIKCDNF